LKDISVTQRGWTLDVLNAIRRLVESRRRGNETPNKKSTDQESLRLLTSSPTGEFTTADADAFTRELKQLHPDNRHVRDKIRQQLQVLPPSLCFGATTRDMGLLLHIVCLLPPCGLPPSLSFGAASRRTKARCLAIALALNSQPPTTLRHLASAVNGLRGLPAGKVSAEKFEHPARVCRL
jgi:hypothetical protein